MMTQQAANAIDAINDAADSVQRNSQHRRHWKNYLNKPGFNLHYTWYFVVSGLVIFGITAVLIHARLGEVTAITNASPMLSLSEQAHVQSKLSEVTAIALAGFSLYLLCSFVTAFVMSHRISGPMIAPVFPHRA